MLYYTCCPFLFLKCKQFPEHVYNITVLKSLNPLPEATFILCLHDFSSCLVLLLMPDHIPFNSLTA